MDMYEVIYSACDYAGISTNECSKRSGRAANYISSMKSRSASIGVPIMVQLLNECNFRLVAVPSDQVPDGALTIEPEDNEDKRAREQERKKARKAKLLAELEQLERDQ